MDAKTILSAGAVGCVGIALVLLGFDVIPQRVVTPHVPDAIMVAVGLGLLLAAAAVFVGLGSRIARRMVGTSLLLMAVAFAWVALFGDPRQMRGGVPFLPNVYNMLLGRFMFGVAALLFLGLGILALRHAKDRLEGEGVERDS